MRYRLPDDEHECISNLRDLAAGGIRFTTDRAISPNTKLTIQVQLPWKDAPLKTSAKVVRCLQLKGTDLYRVSVEFIGLKKQDIVELEVYVDALLQAYKSKAKNISRKT